MFAISPNYIEIFECKARWINVLMAGCAALSICMGGERFFN